MYTLILLLCIITIIILYRTYVYYKKQTREMFKALCNFKEPYYDEDDIKLARPIIDYIDENGFKQKIIYDKGLSLVL